MGTTTTDYGTAIPCVQDIDLSGNLVTGRAVLSQALARRLLTPRGRLIDDANYGYDVAGELGDDLGPNDVSVIAGNIDTEFRKDERVVDSSTVATLSVVGGLQTLTTTSTITDGDGPFPLVLGISGVTVTILGDQG